jgi:hypothetical protein
MRELVYVSTAKLSQFRPDKPDGKLASRVRRLAAKAPLGFGELEVEVGDSSEDRGANLSDVVRHLENNRKISWFAESDLSPGGWVQFETRLNFDDSLDDFASARDSGMVLFWNTLEVAESQGCRLILHGSSRHLTTDLPAANLAPDEVDTGGSADGFFLRLIAELRGRNSRPQEIEIGVREMLSFCDERKPAITASWMAGYARVTACIPRLLDPGHVGRVERLPMDLRSQVYPTVVASPLFVERVDGPNSDS